MSQLIMVSKQAPIEIWSKDLVNYIDVNAYKKDNLITSWVLGVSIKEHVITKIRQCNNYK